MHGRFELGSCTTNKTKNPKYRTHTSRTNQITLHIGMNKDQNVVHDCCPSITTASLVPGDHIYVSLGMFSGTKHGVYVGMCYIVGNLTMTTFICAQTMDAPSLESQLVINPSHVCYPRGLGNSSAHSAQFLVETNFPTCSRILFFRIAQFVFTVPLCVTPFRVSGIYSLDCPHKGPLCCSIRTGPIFRRWRTEEGSICSFSNASHDDKDHPGVFLWVEQQG